jgi:hypothetical protein
MRHRALCTTAALVCVASDRVPPISPYRVGDDDAARTSGLRIDHDALRAALFGGGERVLQGLAATSSPSPTFQAEPESATPTSYCLPSLAPAPTPDPYGRAGLFALAAGQPNRLYSVSGKPWRFRGHTFSELNRPTPDT